MIFISNINYTNKKLYINKSQFTREKKMEQNLFDIEVISFLPFFLSQFNNSPSDFVHFFCKYLVLFVNVFHEKIVLIYFIRSDYKQSIV